MGERERKRAEDIAAAGGARLLTNEMLDKLTDEEMEQYLVSGDLPPGWKKRKENG